MTVGRSACCTSLEPRHPRKKSLVWLPRPVSHHQVEFGGVQRGERKGEKKDLWGFITASLVERVGAPWTASKGFGQGMDGH